MARSGSRTMSPALLRKLHGQRAPVSRSIHGAASPDPKEASCYAALRALEFGESNAETRALRVLYELRRDVDGMTQHHSDLFAALAKRFMADELPEQVYAERFTGYASRFGFGEQAAAMVTASPLYQTAVGWVDTRMMMETITLKQSPTPDEMKRLVLPAAFEPLITLVVPAIMQDDPSWRVAGWITGSMLSDIMLIGLSELRAPTELDLSAAFRKIDWLKPIVPSLQSLMIDRFGARVLARALPNALDLIESALEDKRAPAPWTKQGLRKFRSKLKAELRGATGMGR